MSCDKKTLTELEGLAGLRPCENAVSNGGPISLNVDSVRKMISTRESVVILGAPESGKTWLSEQLADQFDFIVHTDDYIKYGFEQSMYRVLDDVVLAQKLGKRVLVEGVQCYRLLRKGVQLNSFYPQLVIELKVSELYIQAQYQTRGEFGKWRSVKQMMWNNQKVLGDYISMPNKHKPTWVVVKNDRE